MSFAPFHAAFADPLAAARAAKARGQRVVGYLGPSVPVELITAASLAPVHLMGKTGPTPRADEWMEPCFDPIVRSVLDQILAGDLAFLDAIALPRTNDSQQRLYYYLCELRRNGVAIPEPILVDIQLTGSAPSQAYNRARMTELAATFARLGAPLDLPGAIRTHNARRRRLAVLRESGLSGADGLVTLIASRLMDGAAFDMALAAIQPAAPTGRRLLINGNALDRPAIHEAVARRGGVVVADEHGLGDHLIGALVDETGDPLAALAKAAAQAPAARSMPHDPARLVARAQAVRAEAVLFHFIKEEEAMTWDYPSDRAALERAGIRVGCLADQPYPLDERALDAALKECLP